MGDVDEGKARMDAARAHAASLKAVEPIEEEPIPTGRRRSEIMLERARREKENPTPVEPESKQRRDLFD
jgi:hypothetical protein